MNQYSSALKFLDCLGPTRIFPSPGARNAGTGVRSAEAEGVGFRVPEMGALPKPQGCMRITCIMRVNLRLRRCFLETPRFTELMEPCDTPKLRAPAPTLVKSIPQKATSTLTMNSFSSALGLKPPRPTLLEPGTGSRRMGQKVHSCSATHSSSSRFRREPSFKQTASC